MQFVLRPGTLTPACLRKLLQEDTTLALSPECHAGIFAAEEVIARTLLGDKTVYGVNTGFGALATTRIEQKDLDALQRKLVLSHAAGVGEYLSDAAVRLILVLKINSLARGYSGVRMQTLEALIRLFNSKVYPCIPAKGSVGASGDLAPLAHLSAVLLGVGHARYQGEILSAEKALAQVGLQPLTLAPKEGLALLNGTQASTALALLGLMAAEDVFVSAITAGAMSVEAACGSHVPFDTRIQEIRGHRTQMQAAAMLRELLQGSQIVVSHQNCDKVQDPYSLRCQPQVMGACLSHLLSTQDTLITEANGVSDNPLVFSDSGDIVSGGNFHAEPVAFAADTLAIALAEISALSERRIALLVDPHFNGDLPAFLVKEPGLNSGFMLAHVTAAALASENKSLASPVSVDSLPTSANQEDHVSMSMYAARRLLPMAENAAAIVGVELLAAAQAIDFRRPKKTSPRLEKIHQLVRNHVPFYTEDRFFAPDIQKAAQLVISGMIRRESGFAGLPCVIGL